MIITENKDEPIALRGEENVPNSLDKWILI